MHAVEHPLLQVAPKRRRMRDRHPEIFVHVKQLDLRPVDAGPLRQLVEKLVLRIARGNDRAGPSARGNRRNQDRRRIVGRRGREVGQRRKNPNRQPVHVEGFRRGRRHVGSRLSGAVRRLATPKMAAGGISGRIPYLRGKPGNPEGFSWFPGFPLGRRQTSLNSSASSSFMLNGALARTSCSLASAAARSAASNTAAPSSLSCTLIAQGVAGWPVS